MFILPTPLSPNRDYNKILIILGLVKLKSTMQLLSPINVMYYVTAYLKGGAIESQPSQPIKKPSPNPNMGSFDSDFSISDLQLE